MPCKNQQFARRTCWQGLGQLKDNSQGPHRPWKAKRQNDTQTRPANAALQQGHYATSQSVCPPLTEVLEPFSDTLLIRSLRFSSTGDPEQPSRPSFGSPCTQLSPAWQLAARACTSRVRTRWLGGLGLQSKVVLKRAMSVLRT